MTKQHGTHVAVHGCLCHNARVNGTLVFSVNGFDESLNLLSYRGVQACSMRVVQRLLGHGALLSPLTSRGADYTCGKVQGKNVTFVKYKLLKCSLSPQPDAIAITVCHRSCSAIYTTPSEAGRYSTPAILTLPEGMFLSRSIQNKGACVFAKLWLCIAYSLGWKFTKNWKHTK